MSKLYIIYWPFEFEANLYPEKNRGKPREGEEGRGKEREGGKEGDEDGEGKGRREREKERK